MYKPVESRLTNVNKENMEALSSHMIGGRPSSCPTSQALSEN